MMGAFWLATAFSEVLAAQFGKIASLDIPEDGTIDAAVAAALTDAGNPPEGVIIQSGEMHGFYDVDNRVNLYTQMVDFFARHIGGRVDVGDAQRVDAPAP